MQTLVYEHLPEVVEPPNLIHCIYGAKVGNFTHDVISVSRYTVSWIGSFLRMFSERSCPVLEVSTSKCQTP